MTVAPRSARVSTGWPAGGENEDAARFPLATNPGNALRPLFFFHERIRTMTAQPFVVPPQDRTQALRVVGEHITVLASAAQTGSHEFFFGSSDFLVGPLEKMGPAR
jgi:hypothetical protein